VSRRKLGKYEIIDRIGRGGMAEVYRGYHPALDRYVAIKLLHPFLADDPEFKDRFENEARNVARLKHPNIVQVYDFDYDAESESYYMVMELIDGPTLKDRLFDLDMTGERFAIAESIRIIKSAGEALAYAHQRNMIHRDVKPANLMLDADGRVVLTDFGIAKIVTGAQFTASGGMVGTPAYMAPEQGLGEAGDERSDIYSLGVILYQLVTGRLPYDADTPLAIILKHVNEPLPLPSQFVPGLPDDLERIICLALEKEPENRYQTALQFAQDLDLLDETGHVRQGYEVAKAQATTPTFPVASETPVFAQRPAPPATAEFTRASSPASAVPPPAVLTPPPPVRTGASGRLRPAGVAGLSAGVILLVALALFGFGGRKAPLSDLLQSRRTNTPAPTRVAQVEASPGAASNTNPGQTPTMTPSSEPTAAPSATVGTPGPGTLTPTVATSPAVVQVASPTAGEVLGPTEGPSTAPVDQTMTPTLTPNMTGTALADFYATQAAASPTPNMTQTLAACQFAYVVLQPEHHDRPPAATDVNNPRLVPAAHEFSFDLVFQNTGTCAWPDGVRLAYNAELTENPDPSVNLSALKNLCPNDLRPGLNFARQEQPNFYLKGGVDITGESAPVTFMGTAPDVFGCYYSVWDLLYPNSTIPIGRPLLVTIRVWGSG
jgi:serine/threonine protein kinase